MSQSISKEHLYPLFEHVLRLMVPVQEILRMPLYEPSLRGSLQLHLLSLAAHLGGYLTFQDTLALQEMDGAHFHLRGLTFRMKQAKAEQLITEIKFQEYMLMAERVSTELSQCIQMLQHT